MHKSLVFCLALAMEYIWTIFYEYSLYMDTPLSLSFISGNFCFCLLGGMILYANEVETKEK